MPQMKKPLLSLLMVLALTPTLQAQTETFDITTFVPPRGWVREKTGASVSYWYDSADGRVNCAVGLRASRVSNGSPAQNFEEEWEARLGGLFSVRPSLMANNAQTAGGWTTVTGFVNAKPLSDGPGRTTLVTKTGFGKMVSIQLRTSPPEACSAEVAQFLDSLKLNGLAEPKTSQSESFDIATLVPPRLWEWTQTETMALYEVRRTTREGNELCRIQLWESRASSGTPAEDFATLWEEKAVRANRVTGRPSPRFEKTPDGWTTGTGAVDTFGGSEQRGLSMLRIYSGFGKVFPAFVLASKPDVCTQEINEFFRNLQLKAPVQAPAQTLILRSTEPRGFYRSAITPPNDYSAEQMNASFQVYPFRKFDGDIQRMFMSTLLREWIDPRFQESNVLGRPEFRQSRNGFPGSDYVMTVMFFENNVGIAKPHLRWIIVAGGMAAIVDTTASDDATMRRAQPLFDAWYASVRVESAPAPAPRITQVPAPAARGVAGLYMALVNYPRAFTVSNLAAYYYLFSADGHVYRKYDDLNVPGGDPSRFDFDGAERADPVNSGRYSLEGNVLRIQMGAQRSEVITATPRGGNMRIGSTEFERQ
jgi:hypothetical protein